VADLGKDAELGFAPGQWVEIVSHASEVERSPAPLLQITDINPALNKITLSGSTAAWAGHSGLRLRRWDQARRPSLPAAAGSTSRTACR
jgi:hypothetical protein